MKFLKSILKWIVSSWKNLVIVLLIVFGLIFYFRYRSVKNEYDSIIISNNDTITAYKNKVGELYKQKDTYITSIDDLKKENTELYKEVKNLKDNPVVITKIVTNTVIKEITIHDTISVDTLGRYIFPFRYNDQWCNLIGVSITDTQLMTGDIRFDSISFKDNITVNFIEKDKKLSIIAKSDNPYSMINNLNGVVISPENSEAISKRFDKKWVVVAGLGPALTVVDNRMTVLPAIQITFGYKLISF